mgnify:CR=1 FL=1
MGGGWNWIFWDLWGSGQGLAAGFLDSEKPPGSQIDFKI